MIFICKQSEANEYQEAHWPTIMGLWRGHMLEVLDVKISGNLILGNNLLKED